MFVSLKSFGYQPFRIEVVKSPLLPTSAHLIKDMLTPENPVRFHSAHPGRAVPAGWLTLGVGWVARVDSLLSANTTPKHSSVKLFLTPHLLGYRKRTHRAMSC
jgi:hypothetical protein